MIIIKIIIIIGLVSYAVKCVGLMLDEGDAYPWLIVALVCLIAALITILV